jgi:hypothetical protein
MHGATLKKQLNMFRASPCTLSGAYQLQQQQQPLVYRSNVVVVVLLVVIGPVFNRTRTLTPPTTHSNQFQLFHASSRQQYGVMVTRCCSYS